MGVEIEEKEDWHIAGNLSEELETLLKKMVLLDVGDAVQSSVERNRKIIDEKIRFEKVVKAGIYKTFNVFPRHDGYALFLDITYKILFDSPEHPLTIDSTSFTEFHPYVSEKYSDERNALGKEFKEKYDKWLNRHVGREHR
ncbi:MAG: hypothetical protein JHC26_08790 [Thermofilum sp.]|jgi:hypothetical protein|uniref:hypothetical protein n=1 Tax=Thermofilum sp. TaxID=1961369 RepID=UPI002588DC98|nr:hypothetical protein [Thermofilum sp.]MCI4409174.1 hypothetical protein [Thermofilum sp.]